MNNDIVYVVFEADTDYYTHYTVIGVFTSREAACEAMNERFDAVNRDCKLFDLVRRNDRIVAVDYEIRVMQSILQ